jgi:hypothetical protein
MLLSRVIDFRLLTKGVAPGLVLGGVDRPGKALGKDLVGAAVR